MYSYKTSVYVIFLSFILKLIWNGLEIQGQKVLIGNINIPPNMKSHLYMLNKELEKQ